MYFATVPSETWIEARYEFEALPKARSSGSWSGLDRVSPSGFEVGRADRDGSSKSNTKEMLSGAD